MKAMINPIVWIKKNGSILFKNKFNFNRIKKLYIKNIEYELKEERILNKNENILKW